jgi:hypothetical protein
MIKVKTEGRFTKVTEGRKVIFEIMQSRKGNKFHSFRSEHINKPKQSTKGTINLAPFFYA